MQERSESILYPTTGLSCPHIQCGLLFKDQRALKKHCRFHKPNAKLVKCNLCPELFLDSLALQAHFASCHVNALSVPQSPALKRRKVALTKSTTSTSTSAEEITKGVLRQQINSVAVFYDQQLNDLECHQAELFQELANCSAALDRALRFIAQAGGGAISIPYDLQMTARKYARATSSLPVPPS